MKTYTEPRVSLKRRMVCIFALMAVLLGACNTPTPSVDTESTEGTTVTETAAATTESNPLAFAREDNGGKKFTILVSSENDYEFYIAADEETGDLVPDAIYRRNLAVEEYLGITLEAVSKPGGWSERNKFNALITQDVSGGTQEYDLVSSPIVISVPLSTQGMFKNLLTMKGLDLSNSWWIKNQAEQLNIANKLFFACGDANLSMYKTYSVIFFNQAVLDEFKFTSPYKLVENNEWTIDRLIEMATSVCQDLNNDGKIAEADDKYGYLVQNVPHRSWQTACEAKVLDRNSEDEIYVPELSERMVNLYDKLLNFAQNPARVRNNGTVNFYEFTHPFSQDRVLFLASYLYSAESGAMRDMKTDYGIVPYPKYDTNQKEYHTQIGTATSIYYVPVTVKSSDLTAKVMELTGYLNQQSVVPAYYETAMKDKYSRDETVPKMLDIIRDSAMLSMDFVYSTTLSQPTYAVAINESKTPAVNYAERKGAWEASLAAIVEAYAKLED